MVLCSPFFLSLAPFYSLTEEGKSRKINLLSLLRYLWYKSFNPPNHLQAESRHVPSESPSRSPASACSSLHGQHALSMLALRANDSCALSHIPSAHFSYQHSCGGQLYAQRLVPPQVPMTAAPAFCLFWRPKMFTQPGSKKR